MEKRGEFVKLAVVQLPAGSNMAGYSPKQHETSANAALALCFLVAVAKTIRADVSVLQHLILWPKMHPVLGCPGTTGTIGHTGTTEGPI